MVELVFIFSMASTMYDDLRLRGVWGCEIEREGEREKERERERRGRQGERDCGGQVD
jgi:hypothetical protein